jgi:hypothetical protein
MTCCYSEKNFGITTFYRYLVRFPIRGIGPSKAHTCNGKQREKKAYVLVWHKWDSNNELNFFRADKDRQCFKSSDDSHVAYISNFKKSPSILNELVEIYLSYPSPICLHGVDVKALPFTFLPSSRSLMAILQDLIRKWVGNSNGSHSQALQLSVPSVGFESNFYTGYN